MTKMLIHVTCGPENPTKAALGLLVARTAIEQGHEVDLFFAGDAVQLMRPTVLDNLVGLGTGALRDHCNAIIAGGGRFHLSGMSSACRGVTEDVLSNLPACMAMPNELVRLSLEADAVLTY